jgi:hypothetical protein
MVRGNFGSVLDSSNHTSIQLLDRVENIMDFRHYQFTAAWKSAAFLLPGRRLKIFGGDNYCNFGLAFCIL